MDTRLKERLVGAVALVVLVVLVVPELLTGPRRTAPAAPPDGPNPVRTVVVDLTASESSTTAPPAVAATPAVAPPVIVAPPPAAAHEDPSPSAAAPTPAPAEAPPPAPAAGPKPATASTSSPAPVANAAAPATARPAPVEAPKPAPAEAEKAPAPKPAAKPAKVAAAGAEGWVVQLGSFASRDNGEKLANALRAKGYRAFVSEFRGSGRILYRVRVGPEQDRARAEAIAARLGRDGYKGSVAPH